ncbi:hypothetical protein [Flavobacterium collinsii]|uniref:SMODS and SLOG-associating 2TM effector domain-containing protein n=1 Tax=Flavobacterium collinsii TaxID=1114861 RepID=A0ABM8KDU8_9FLAO|nr:hypothetical protein [Flavobacterium collinsii]CAA9195089.1 hypothetical protein FLACOL7796_00434 [Flavobacterium collinsii]
MISEDFISLIIMLLLSFIFHYFQKICERDYTKAKEDFYLLIKENKKYSEWDYNYKKSKMDIDNTRKWVLFLFKLLSFMVSIHGLTMLLINS